MIIHQDKFTLAKIIHLKYPHLEAAAVLVLPSLQLHELEQVCWEVATWEHPIWQVRPEVKEVEALQESQIPFLCLMPSSVVAAVELDPKV